ncbi:glycosyltransferase family 2 protein [Camelimonas abortus]|uniref:Glycosyltransferase family 2 protein n=1 Tax=Camelimonas abortus TaxID=1017184 RepID=A0ABV7LAU2_9HYPH
MTSSDIQISVFVIARDEADRIGPVLDAARRVSDDVIVIDSGSTDGTQEVARARGARVIHHDWPGYGMQKRFGEDQCRHDWVLNLDADEVMPDDLLREIRALFAAGPPPCDAYRIRIAEMFPGEKAPHPLGFSLAPVRLYRRSAGRYSASPVHDRVELKPGTRVGRLKGVIHHFSVRSIGDQIAKLNRYTDMQADDLEARGVKVSAIRLLLEFPANFLKAYVVRRHALRGVYGFMTAMNFAFYRYLRVAKHMERRLAEKARREGRL